MVGNHSDHQLKADAVCRLTTARLLLSLLQSSSRYLTWPISSLLKIHSKCQLYKQFYFANFKEPMYKKLNILPTNILVELHALKYNEKPFFLRKPGGDYPAA